MVAIESALYNLILCSGSLLLALLLVMALSRLKRSKPKNGAITQSIINPPKPAKRIPTRLGSNVIYFLGEINTIDIDSVIEFVDEKHSQLDEYSLDKTHITHMPTGDRLEISTRVLYE